MFIKCKSYLYHKPAIWLVKRSGEGAEREVSKGKGGKGAQDRKGTGREKKERRKQPLFITALLWVSYALLES